MPTDTTLEELEQKVNATLPKVIDNDGHIDWTKADEELTPELKVAIIAEKRRRDTQASYTKNKQELASIKRQKEELESSLTEYIAKSLTSEQRDELDDLKYNDPDAYIEQIESLKEEAYRKATEQKQAILEKASKESSAEAILVEREAVLEQFNATHPDTPLTIDMLDSEVPLRIVKKLERGELSFEQALEESHKFIYGSKVVSKGKEPIDNKLGNAGSTAGVNPPSGGNEEEEIF